MFFSKKMSSIFLIQVSIILLFFESSLTIYVDQTDLTTWPDAVSNLRPSYDVAFDPGVVVLTNGTDQLLILSGKWSDCGTLRYHTVIYNLTFGQRINDITENMMDSSTYQLLQTKGGTLSQIPGSNHLLIIPYEQQISGGPDIYVEPILLIYQSVNNTYIMANFLPPFSYTFSTSPGHTYGQIFYLYPNDTYPAVMISPPSGPIQFYQNQPGSLNWTLFDPVGSVINSIAGGSSVMADFNQDGYDDLFFSGNYLLINQQNGTFLDQSGLISGVSIIGSGSIKVADFNGDGWPDITILSNVDVAILQNNISNNGGFILHSLTTGNLQPLYQSSIAAGDWNNDGLLDLVTCGIDGSFQFHQSYHQSLGLWDNFTDQTPSVMNPLLYCTMLWIDYNTDGLMDVISAGNPGPSISADNFKILLNDGLNGWTDQTDNLIQMSTSLKTMVFSSISINDFNKDTCPDLLLMGQSGDTFEPFVEVMSGNCSGIFSLTGYIFDLATFGSLTSIDINNLDYPDIVVSGYDTTTSLPSLKYYRNNNGASFIQSTSQVLLPSYPGLIISDLVPVDYNQDGWNDLSVCGTDDAPYSAVLLVYQNLQNGSLYRMDLAPPVHSCYLSWSEIDPSENITYPELFGMGEDDNMVDYSFLLVYLGNGTFEDQSYRFTPPLQPVAAGGSAWYDVQGDNLTDLIYLGWNGGTYYTLSYQRLSNQTFLQTSWLSQLPGLAIGRVQPIDGDLIIFGNDVNFQRYFYYLHNQYQTNQTSPFIDQTLEYFNTGSNLIKGVTQGDSAVSDLNKDNHTDITIFGSFDGCTNSILIWQNNLTNLTTSSIDPSTTSSTTTTNPENSSNTDDNFLAVILGSTLGGSFLLFLLAIFACYLLGCCLLIAFLLILLIIVIILLVLIVIVALIGGTVLTFGGLTSSLFIIKKKRIDPEELNDQIDEKEVDEEELKERISHITEYRVISVKELTFGKKIGAGAYGAVYLGQWNGVDVAIKTLQVELSEAAYVEFEREALMMTRVSHHPNVIPFVGAVVEPTRLCLVTHFCSGGSLDTALTKGKLKDQLDLKLKIIKGTAAALSFLHSIGMVHRDIAARNVLLGQNYHPYLCDFGFARVVDLTVRPDGENNTKDNIGPIRWMAPEAMRESKYSFATDAYSFGITIWEILEDGRIPFDHYQNLVEVATSVLGGETLPINSSVPARLTQLMRDLWNQEPTKRPKMTDVISILKDLDKELDEEESMKVSQLSSLDNPSTKNYSAIYVM